MEVVKRGRRRGGGNGGRGGLSVCLSRNMNMRSIWYGNTLLWLDCSCLRPKLSDNIWRFGGGNRFWGLSHHTEPSKELPQAQLLSLTRRKPGQPWQSSTLRSYAHGIIDLARELSRDSDRCCSCLQQIRHLLSIFGAFYLHNRLAMNAQRSSSAQRSTSAFQLVKETENIT